MDGGVEKLDHPNRAGTALSRSGAAGSAEAMESDVSPIPLGVPARVVPAHHAGLTASSTLRKANGW